MIITDYNSSDTAILFLVFRIIPPFTHYHIDTSVSSICIDHLPWFCRRVFITWSNDYCPLLDYALSFMLLFLNCFRSITLLMLLLLSSKRGVRFYLGSFMLSPMRLLSFLSSIVISRLSFFSVLNWLLSNWKNLFWLLSSNYWLTCLIWLNMLVCLTSLMGTEWSKRRISSMTTW